MKTTLLNAFQCNADGFMEKFRSCRPQKGEIFSSFFGRLSRYFTRWLELSEVDASEPEQILDFFLRDQIYASCHADLVAYLKEQQPPDCPTMVRIAERYALAHPSKSLSKAKQEPLYPSNVGVVQRGRSQFRHTQNSHGQQNQRSASAPPGDKRNDTGRKFCSICKKTGHTDSECYFRKNGNTRKENHRKSTGQGPKPSGGANNVNNQKESQIICHRCGGSGHIARQCPSPYSPPTHQGSVAETVEQDELSS